MLLLDQTAVTAQDQASLDFVLKLADIARPGILHHEFQSPRGKVDFFFFHLPGVSIDKIIDEEEKVALPFPKRGHFDGQDAQPEVEVNPKISPLNLRLDILVGGADEPDIDPPCPVLANSPDFPFLEKAEQLGLEGEGQIADLVKEKSAAVGFLDKTRFIPEGTGKRPLGVTKKLALQKVIRNGPTIDSDEGFVPPRSPLMDRTSDELFSRSAFPINKYGRFGIFNPVNEHPDLLGTPAGANNGFEGGLAWRGRLFFCLSPEITQQREKRPGKDSEYLEVNRGIRPRRKIPG